MASVNATMKRYTEVADAIFGYFEENLGGDGANSFAEYKEIVTDANVGPLDEELWKILERVTGKPPMGGKRSRGTRKSKKSRKSKKTRRH